MIKLGEFWLNVEKVNMAVVDKHGTLTVYFSKDASVKIDGNVRPDEVKRIVACLDAAAGCTPAAKTEAEGGETLYGMAPDGQEIQETVLPMPEAKPTSGKTHLDLVRELNAVDLANLLIDGACPPSPSEDCPHEDCVQCWVNWLEGSADGDPDA